MVRDLDRHHVEAGGRWEPGRWVLGTGSPALHVLRLLAHLIVMPAAIVTALVVWALMPLLRLKEEKGVRFD